MTDKPVPTFEELMGFVKLFIVDGNMDQSNARMRFLKALYDEHVHKLTATQDEWVVYLANLKQEYLYKGEPRFDGSTSLKAWDDRKAFAEAMRRDLGLEHWIHSVVHLDPKACKSEIGDPRQSRPSGFDVFAIDSVADMYPELHSELIRITQSTPTSKNPKVKNKPWYTSFAGKAGKPPRY